MMDQFKSQASITRRKKNNFILKVFCAKFKSCEGTVDWLPVYYFVEHDLY